MIRAGVVIPTYRNDTSLRTTLKKLYDQTIDRSEYQILVVDNNNDDTWAAKIRSTAREFGAVYVREDRPGAGAARAAGVDAASGAVMVFVDDDVEVADDFLEAHLKYQDTGPGVVVGSIRTVTTTAPWFERHLRRTGAVNVDVKLGVPLRPGQFYGTNTSVPRELVLKVGNFDPDFQRRQDSELGYRLHKAGVPTIAAPDIVVHHYMSIDVGSYIRRARRNGYYFGLFLEKHPECRATDLRYWFKYPWLRYPFQVLGSALLPVGRLLEPVFPWLLDRAMNGRLLAEHIKGYLDFQNRTAGDVDAQKD